MMLEQCPLGEDVAGPDAWPSGKDVAGNSTPTFAPSDLPGKDVA